MPYYNFGVIDEKGKIIEEFTEFMTINELDWFLEKNPKFKQLVSKINISYSGRGVQIDSGFRDILKKIKKDSPGNTITIPGIKVK